MKEYEWFRVYVKKKDDGNCYMVLAFSSLDSRKFEEVFVPPLDEREAEGLLHDIEESLKPERKLLGHRKLMETGQRFYKSIFSAELEKCFRDCLKNAMEKGRGLRLELVIDPSYLRRLPWELLHDDNGFLALSTDTPIVRTAHRVEQPQFREIQYPLGILFVAASPVGPHVPIGVGCEIRLLCEGVSKEVDEGRVFLQCYGGRKFKSRDFSDDLKSKKFSVLHFSAHGKFVEEIERGVLQLEDEDGRPFLISVETLAEWLRGTSIRMVFLDACETGVGSVRNPLADLGHLFLDKGIGAVVAMQFSVPVSCANAFCRAFYTLLAEGEPPEYCVSQARTRIVNSVFGLDTIEWAIPVLHVCGKEVLHVGGERKPRSYRTLPALGLFVGRDIGNLTI